MDGLLVFFGILFLLYGIIMLCVYVFSEKGTVLDPIAVSWFGFLLNIPLALLAVGLIPYERPGYAVRGPAVIILLTGTLFYTLGLYAGKGTRMKNWFPRPAPTLSPAQVLFVFCLCTAAVVLSFSIRERYPPALMSVVLGLTSGSIGALSLISLLVVLTYRQRLLFKAFMLGVLGIMFFLTYRVYFSRRPLVSLFLAGVCFIYYFKLLDKGKLVKCLFWGFTFFVGFFLILLAGATRAERFYGYAEGVQKVFSSENIDEFIGGLAINYLVFEYTVHEIPVNAGYLYGKGLVPGFIFWIPRAIWPSKPISSGAVITRIWYNDPDPPSNVANLPFGELYMNFGWLGVTLGFFLVGKFVRGLNTYWIDNTGNVVLALAWFLVIPSFAAQWRGDFTSMFVQGLMSIIVFLGIAWFSGKLFVPKSMEPDRLTEMGTTETQEMDKQIL